MPRLVLVVQFVASCTAAPGAPSTRPTTLGALVDPAIEVGRNFDYFGMDALRLGASIVVPDCITLPVDLQATLNGVPLHVSDYGSYVRVYQDEHDVYVCQRPTLFLPDGAIAEPRTIDTLEITEGTTSITYEAPGIIAVPDIQLSSSSSIRSGDTVVIRIGPGPTNITRADVFLWDGKDQANNVLLLNDATSFQGVMMLPVPLNMNLAGPGTLSVLVYLKRTDFVRCDVVACTLLTSGFRKDFAVVIY
jgi:hypothetical protein